MVFLMKYNVHHLYYVLAVLFLNLPLRRHNNSCLSCFELCRCNTFIIGIVLLRIKLRRALLLFYIRSVPALRSSKGAKKWTRADSDRRPPHCKCGALPTKLQALNVGGEGIEPRTTLSIREIYVLASWWRVYGASLPSRPPFFIGRMWTRTTDLVFIRDALLPTELYAHKIFIRGARGPPLAGGRGGRVVVYQ